MSDFKKLYAKLDRIQKYLDNQLPTIIGVEAVNFFKESFDNQGFTDQTLEKWKEVKRRDPKSVWYGFKYGATSPVPDNHPKRKGAKSKWKQRKAGASSNYSPTATKTKILHSQQNELKNSIKYTPMTLGAKITAAGVYAKVINEGGKIKVFGKTPATMPKRQFMGTSQVLNRKLAEIIKHDISKILNG